MFARAKARGRRIVDRKNESALRVLLSAARFAIEEHRAQFAEGVARFDPVYRDLSDVRRAQLDRARAPEYFNARCATIYLVGPDGSEPKRYAFNIANTKGDKE